MNSKFKPFFLIKKNLSVLLTRDLVFITLIWIPGPQIILRIQKTYLDILYYTYIICSQQLIRGRVRKLLCQVKFLFVLTKIEASTQIQIIYPRIAQ